MKLETVEELLRVLAMELFLRGYDPEAEAARYAVADYRTGKVGQATSWVRDVVDDLPDAEWQAALRGRIYLPADTGEDLEESRLRSYAAEALGRLLATSRPDQPDQPAETFAP